MGAWLGFAGLLVAIAAIPTTIWATRQWGNRRARVEFSFVSVPLLPSDTGQGLLEVTYQDIPVKDPHLVTVTLRNTGPRDIATATFDDGKSIAVRFNQTFYGLTKTQGDMRIMSVPVGTSATEAVVLFQPALLKRGEEWSFSAVLSGPVEVSITAPLIDTDVARADPERDDRAIVDISLGIAGLAVPMISGPAAAVISAALPSRLRGRS